MPPHTPSLRRTPAHPPSMDYAQLRQQGIEAVQRLSGDVWTDYNEHDPGVTILENLCYAITELGYKTRLPIEDLLFGKGSGPFDARDHAMYPPEEVLPAAPLTLLDFRKLLIDRIPAVRNAWLVPAPKSTAGVNMQGLYQVLLQLEPNAEADPAAVQAEAYRLMRAHRNLCEDVDQVTLLQPQPIQVSARIHISPQVVGESILAQILFVLSDTLTPQVRFHTLDAWREAGHSLDEVFEGPLPVHGFIDDGDLLRSELENLRTLHQSRLIQQISEIEGVLSVEFFQLRIKGEAVKQETIRLASRHYPALDLGGLLHQAHFDENYPIQLESGDFSYQLDLETAARSFDMLMARHKQQYERPLALEAELPTSDRKLSEVATYHTIQHHFPEAYGLGEKGLPSRASLRRRGRAKQLQAYLLIFEQLMANYLSQLINVRHLFSTRPEGEQTYFFQTLFDLPGTAALLGQDREAFSRELARLVAQYDHPLARRHRIMDHLLARFGETFLSEAFNALNRQAGGQDQVSYTESLLDAKLQYLQAYLPISRDRGKGYDYTQPLSDPHNIAGLRQRISLLFGITDFGHPMLTRILDQDRAAGGALDFSREKPKSPAKDGFVFQGDQPDILAQVLSFGLDRNLYRIGTRDDQVTIFFRLPEGEEQAVFQASSVEAAEEALTRLIAHLHALNRKSEGFHLIEHVLLRPVAPASYLVALSGDRRWLEATYAPTGGEGAGPLVEAFEAQLRQEKNLSIQAQGKGKKAGFVVVLQDAKGGVLAQSEAFLSESAAQEHLDGLLKWLKGRKGGVADFLEVHPRVPRGAMISGRDPYSLQISVLLPAWTARFQNPKLRKLMEQVIKAHSPAHLVVHFLPLGLEDMREFEHAYQAWAEAKASPETPTSTLDDLSYFLLLLLKAYRLTQEPAYEGRDYDEALVAEDLPSLRQRFGTAVTLFDG